MMSDEFLDRLILIKSLNFKNMALLSKNRLSKFMLGRLEDLPAGTDRIKDRVIYALGNIAIMSTKRDLDAAWNDTKKKAVKQYPDRFILDGRNALHWNDGSVIVLDKKITAANFKKLNELADAKGVNVNKMVTKLIGFYKKGKK